jgi:mannosyltransferase
VDATHASSTGQLVDAKREKNLTPLAPIDRWFSLGAIGISIVVLWLPYLRSSFWLDETGTAWIVSGSLGQTISRSAGPGLAGQSPLYYVLVWIARAIFGSSETALRLPSLVAATLTVWVVYRIGVNLFNRTAAALAAVTFSALICIAFAAVDARPYALAMLTFSFSTLMLLRWEESHARRFAIGYVLFAAFTIYMTYMFGVGLLAHGIYAYRRAHRGGVPVSRFLLSWISIVGLTIPSLPHLYRVLTAPDILKWVGSHNDEYLGDSQILLPVLAALLAAVMAMRVTRASRTKIRSAPAATFLVGSMALTAPLCFLVLSYSVAPKFFVHRYFLEFAVGVALAMGFLLASMPLRVRYIGLGVLLLIPILGYRGDVHRQDWRGAARAISARAGYDTPVLLSGFSSQPTSDPERSGFLRAPLSVYQVRGRIILLPADLSAGNLPQLEAIVHRDLVKSQRFFLVTGFAPRPFRTWLETSLADAGFRDETTFSGPWLEVTEFDRTAPA